MEQSLRERLKSRYYEHPVVWPVLKKMQEWNNRAQYRWYYRFPGHDTRVSVREINIEFNSACNLRCKFCALDHDKPKRSMSPLVLRRFLDQFIEDKRFHAVEKFQLYNGGETLLHPKRIEMLRIIKEYKKIATDRGIHFPKVSMLTNGMLLREKLAREIVDEGLVDEVGFSLDGGTPEDFEDLRVNAKWKPFYENVKFFTEYARASNHPIRVYGITIVPEPRSLDYKWMHPEFVELGQLFDHHELRRLHDWGGEVDLLGDHNKGVGRVAELAKDKKVLKDKGCDLLLRQMIWLPNGDVTICCNDLNSKGVVGNIMNNTLWELYDSPERRKYLDLLDAGRKSELELCKDCQTF